MTAINSNRAIRGPVTAVPVVAGKGVRLVADTVNNRWVVEADETVLWDSASGSLITTGATFNLSESYKNFERIRIVAARVTLGVVSEYYTALGSESANMWISSSQTASDGNLLIDSATLEFTSNTVITVLGIVRKVLSASNHSTSTSSPMTLYKVIGINRVASA
jgi:hypothetical protein